MKKPKTCRECPVSRVVTGKVDGVSIKKLECKPYPKNYATSVYEEKVMYKNCPLNWATQKL
jgi:hypothetical protein